MLLVRPGAPLLLLRLRAWRAGWLLLVSLRVRATCRRRCPLLLSGRGSPGGGLLSSTARGRLLSGCCCSRGRDGRQVQRRRRGAMQRGLGRELCCALLLPWLRLPLRLLGGACERRRTGGVGRVRCGSGRQQVLQQALRRVLPSSSFLKSLLGRRPPSVAARPRKQGRLSLIVLLVVRLLLRHPRQGQLQAPARLHATAHAANPPAHRARTPLRPASGGGGGGGAAKAAAAQRPQLHGRGAAQRHLVLVLLLEVGRGRARVRRPGCRQLQRAPGGAPCPAWRSRAAHPAERAQGVGARGRAGRGERRGGGGRREERGGRRAVGGQRVVRAASGAGERVRRRREGGRRRRAAAAAHAAHAALGAAGPAGQWSIG